MADHRNNDFFHHGGAPTAADAPDSLFGYASREDLRQAYQAEMTDLGHALEKPVQDHSTAADKYAHAGKRRH